MERDVTGPEQESPDATVEPAADPVAPPDAAEPDAAAGLPEAAAERESAADSEELTAEAGEAGSDAEDPAPVTGDSRVNAALSELDSLAATPVAEHPAVFERIHGQLVEVFGELHSSSAQGPAGRQAS